jgi:hypothetical protein
VQNEMPALLEDEELYLLEHNAMQTTESTDVSEKHAASIFRNDFGLKTKVY